MISVTALPSYRPKLYSAVPPLSSTQSVNSSSGTRPLYIRGNVTSQAAGSATCELGRTKVVCSVHGPRARRQAGRAEFSGRGAIDESAAQQVAVVRREPDRDAIRPLDPPEEGERGEVMRVPAGHGCLHY